MNWSACFLLKMDWQGEVLLAMLTDFQPLTGPSTYNGYLHRIVSEEVEIFQVIGLNFDKGRLLIFESVTGSPGYDQKKSPPNRILSQSYNNLTKAIEQQTRVPMAILCARLNKADVLSNEMLTKDFSRLLNRLWELTRETIEEYGGLFSQYEASGLIGYFILAENVNNNSINVIQCALELKNRISDLGRQWKIQKGWLHDIELNIGIHVGDEYFTSLSTSSGGNFISLGDALTVAISLSTLSHSGQIWASKEVIDQLSSAQLDELRFGIFRMIRSYQTNIYPEKFFKNQ